MELDMNRVESRIKSYKWWPIEDEPGCVCTIKKMAESGFFHCGGDDEPDLTRCFVCFKEMEGWEAEDNPMGARYHTKKCAFAKLGKPASELTKAEIVKLINFQQTERLRMLCEQRAAEF
ncbi:baculoviral IAP repeat-containing protein 5-like, partial [Pollicipes pollicipes]|uniref:baculoviral IAP repeat-containing protein 5-like n=1 Tax=Pollicipes pollicipes TaxID=41117 RepID=UPI0018853C42